MFHLQCRKLLTAAVKGKELLNTSLKYPLYLSKAGYPSKKPYDHGETDEEFDTRMFEYFSRNDVDGWELRKGLNDLAGIDAVPDPKVIIAALHAARRMNDYAVTTRCLEMVKFKCGPKVEEIWPYILQEIGPTLKELGITTPDEMGYGSPEMALVDVYEVI